MNDNMRGFLPEVPAELIELIDKFERNLEAYKNPSYKEEQLKQEFINPFFKALGWDVDNTSGAAPQYRDVIFEDSIKIAGGTRAPDYCFTLAGRKMFFVEAKKPSVNIETDIKPSYQLRRYAWSAKLPLSILTDFEEFAVYDSRSRPKKTDRASTGRIKILTYKDYVDEWDYLFNTFSKNAVLQGSYEKYAETTKKKRGTTLVDDEFLSEIETWRELLAKDIAIRNHDLTVDELNYSVQQIIDRIIFLRMGEDRGAEKYGQLQKLLKKQDIYTELCQIWKEADAKYNSGLFHFQEEKGQNSPPDTLTPQLEIKDGVFKQIIKNLYYPDSPYEFSVLSPEILGNVYEQFLGKVIRLTPGHRAKVEEKPEVKKAGGVYYTPQYIVEYIVENTVGKLCKDKTPKKISNLRILDPACGSGSFLLGAYNYLLQWHLDYYTNLKDKKRLKNEIYKGKNNEWHLTVKEKKRILLNNIYGVDIDHQAVEVTKLSLLLKVLEGENKDVIEAQKKLFKERALPDLDNNIKCGNTLIGPDIFEIELDNEIDIQVLNAFDWNVEFSAIMEDGGFDSVIGNPPYVRSESIMKYKSYFKNYVVFSGNADLYTYFIEKGIELLKKNGVYSIIVANKWIRASYGKKLREFLTSFSIEEIIDFGDLQVFQGATTYPCILTVKNVHPSNKIGVVNVENLHFRDLRDYVNQNLFYVNQNLLDGEGWALIDENSRLLLEKMHSISIPLTNYIQDKAHYGIKTGLNEAFIIDEQTKDLLISQDINNKDIIKPLIRGRDVKRWKTNFQMNYVILVGFGEGKNLKQKYPTIYLHLKKFEKKLKNRGQVKNGQHHWLELDNNPSREYLNRFTDSKILYLVFQVKPAFTYDNTGYYANNAVWIIPKDDKYLLGILNSKVGWFMISNYCTQIRNGYQLMYKYLKKIPIRKIDFNNYEDVNLYKRMVKLVEKVLELHERLNNSKIPHENNMFQRQIDALDEQINRLTYILYDLTDKEIDIIENTI